MKIIALTLSLALAPLALAGETHHMHNQQLADNSAGQAQQPARKASATGTVRAIDRENATITIAHDPVPQLRWPAMVMPFNASGEQMQQVAVGDKVSFEFTSSAAAAALVSIEKR